MPIDGETAAWARKRIRLSVEDAAKQLGVKLPYLLEIELGNAEPTAGQFRKMASVYALSEATLLGFVPPDDRPLPQDFRSFQGDEVALSYQTAKICRVVQARQETLEYLSDLDPSIVPPELKVLTLSADPDKEGRQFRVELGLSVQEQLSISPQKAWVRWRTLIEGLGVSVYVEELGNDGARGVSIFYNAFPAIVVGQSEKQHGARLFTLFHEFAHILLRREGISDLKTGSNVESFCNRFAAGFLMPPEAIAAVFLKTGPEPTISQLDAAARKLCVTISQLALRLEHLSYAKSGYFNKIVAALNFSRAEKSTKKESGPEYRYTYLSQYGQHLTASVLGALKSGAIETVEASRMLNSNPVHFKAFAATIKERNPTPLDIVG